MIMPNVSPPVNRRKQFDPVYELIKHHSRTCGCEIPEQELVVGAPINPNDPHVFIPVPCPDWCPLFSGFSMANCLSACRI